MKPRGRKAAEPLRSPEEVEKLVSDNMALVHFFSAKYQNVYHDEHDRLSFAMEGLVQAARYWKDNGVRFGTYASMRIIWMFRRINTASKRAKRGGGTAVHIPLDMELENGTELHELMEDPNAKQPGQSMAEEAERVVELLLTMPERERDILMWRFGLGNYEAHTLDAIAPKLGLTRERVRQIEQIALARLKALSRGQPFRWDSEKHCDQNGERAGSCRSTKPRKMTKEAWQRHLRRHNPG
jgi:RNA polymerase sporulation-specific sigma factor